jgi:YfiH family protein
VTRAYFIEPDWPVPAGVRALSTVRTGGVSVGPYQGLNLGAHVGDAPEAVATNRELLARAAGLDSDPLWLDQVHSPRAVNAADWQAGVQADACVALSGGQVCAIMTADCLPVLFCDQNGQSVAAAHAGWRGLLSGVLESTLFMMNAPPSKILAWIGPGIGQQAFEVGGEVREAFVAQDAGAAVFFVPNPAGRWQADLPGLARHRLNGLGLERVFGGDLCTASDPQRFFSYRRDGQCGRMASMVWLEK